MKASMKTLAAAMVVAGFCMAAMGCAKAPQTMPSTNTQAKTTQMPANNLVMMKMKYMKNGKMHSTNVYVMKSKVNELKAAKKVEMYTPVIATS